MSTATATLQASRMRLDNLTKGKIKHPKRIALFAPEGIGKSTFGANAEKPIFLCAEEGTANLDVSRFPTPRDWNEVLEAVRTLTNETHDFGTLVIDTVDWVEPLVWSHICARDSRGLKEPLRGVEDYGFQKGYVVAVDEWRVLLGELERMRRAKGMHVIMLAHALVKSFKNPEGPDYDRYEMKLHHKASGLLREWSDIVLFANYEILSAQDKQTKRYKGVDNGGARVAHTQRSAAFDAKNRYGMPERMPLAWVDIIAAAEAGESADPSELTNQIQEKSRGTQFEKDIVSAIVRANGDATKLTQLNNWLNAKIEEKK